MANPKILIVDDEPFNVDYLEQELAESAYDTLSAPNGRDALAAVASQRPDLVLLDIMMPGMDGFEVLSRLKADPATRDIPVIVISADNNMPSVVKGIELGAEDYLPKPFDPTLLHARIASSLEKKRLRDLQQLYLKSLEREFEIARDIQMSFLPDELPRVAGWEIAAYFKAAREVAGDFYDAFPTPDGNFACVIGDVCGKGIGAALFMTLFRSLIRATATSDLACAGVDNRKLLPAERLENVINFTNRYITNTHGDASMNFSTVFIGIFDLQKNMLTYMNCGNEAPLLLGADGQVSLLGPTGPVVGVLPEAKFEVKAVPFTSGDLLLAFTDGITDALDEQIESFGPERVKTLLAGNSANPQALLDFIQDELCRYMGNAEQFDDITMLAVKKLS
jgi:serine phosphatase RsbU (regulator of sigma subunit)